MSFKPVTSKVDFAKQEVEITQYWKQRQIFEKSISSRPADKRWTFLDGPPFVTGMPHYGSLLSSLPKDLFGRYWTMKGYRVRRVWGWDGHGLPIENKVETELKVTRKRDIEEVIGVKKFIDECLNYVNSVSSEWEWYVDRIGRWADFENAYKTWDTPYMESVMWVFKQMYDKGHIYKGHKVSLYCPHCSTPISNFEVAMDAENYKEVVDAATTYKFELTDRPGTYILAWSTTPWNKIVTTALAVNPELPYVTVKQGDERYILAESTLKVLGDEQTYQVESRQRGVDLVGMKYQPHYDYFREDANGSRVFEVVPADFVTAEDGTGVVTIAAYGEDDLKLMQQLGLHIQTHLDEEGTINSEVPQFGGMYYLKANKEVDQDLERRGLIYKLEEHPHRVPLCWRCHTRLYYAPINAWYVDIQSLKPLLKDTNEQVNWFPKHFKYGRFLKSLESAPDWNISRNRYWGSPVPVWECACGERFVPGSIAELEQASGQTVTGLHKPEIDDIVVPCQKCGQSARRTPETLDTWMDAGSASFAERHFPFNNEEQLEDFFPPDFIGEYTGQIRAWFYVLHVIGAALYQSPAYKNVIVEGVILGTDGRKMSKNFKNYPDPAMMLDTYGGDALRLYLLGSPVMHGEDILISEESYRNQVRGTMLILWNTYNFFVSYANLDNWQPKEGDREQSTEVLDRWILSLLNKANRTVTRSLESYNTVEAIETLKQFVADFSTWYIRRSRDRVGPSAIDQVDKSRFYTTAHEVLGTLSQLMAPIVPFMSEEIYRNLTGEESVHLSYWPELNSAMIDEDLEGQMKSARSIVEVGHAVRSAQGLKLKQPLLSATYNAPIILPAEIEALVKLELNVLSLKFGVKTNDVGVEYDTALTDELRDMGQARELVRTIQAERKQIGCALDARIRVFLPDWPASQAEDIKRQTLADELIKGEQLKIEVVS
jgi:isoleucyl-tRNA synthetase